MTPRPEGGAAANDATGPRRARSAGDLLPGEFALLQALMAGPVSREQADRVAVASNSPNIVFNLRSSGLGIDCELRTGLNRIGKKTRYGVYSLTPAGRTLAASMFKLQADELAERQTRPPANDAQA